MGFDIFNLIEKIAERVFIIAEVGCNHNGDLDIAKSLVDAGLNAGADAVKFQSFRPEEMSVRHTPKADYQLRATGSEESQFNRLKRMSLDEDSQRNLKAYCDKKRILFCSSPFDCQSADFLNKLNVSFFKIPSGEITNTPFLKHIGSFGKPIILSTGMSNLGEVEIALNAINWESKIDIILMHCLSDYPAMWQEANLKAMHTLGNAFNLPVGFSDHTKGIEVALVAVGMGAVVIEKHITLDRNMEGGDHKASLEPHEFKHLVEKIRKIEAALGDGVKRCMPSEENVRDVARKSIVCRKYIKKGHVIQRDDISIKRPGTGISPNYFNEIVGSIATEDIKTDELISWHQIELKTNNCKK